MSNQHRKQSIYINLVLVIVLAILVNGCAVGVTRVEITHDPLDHIENKKEGSILVKQFVDKREDTQHIGNKRNMFGMVLGHIGAGKGIKIEEILTMYFAEALKEAGYNAEIQKTLSADVTNQVKFDAIIGGEIVEFWLDLYMAVWHKVGVLIKVYDPTNQNVLWEMDVRGEEKNVLWLGTSSEYERVIRQALTKALNQVTKEFASDEFYNAIKK